MSIGAEFLDETELAKHLAERPWLRKQFVDLEQDRLAAVTDEEQANIPEAGDLTRRTRERHFERSSGPSPIALP
jgi:hypothetical protein